MTTCRQTITYALRQARVLASGDDPSSDEAADGLVALQALYDLWVANGMFGRLTDVYVTEDYEAEEGERVIAPSGVTITFPTTIDDECEDSRAPRDLSCIETIIDGVRVVKVWDRTGWVDLLGLELDDDAPLSSRSAWGLAAALATSGAFSALFGGEPGPDIRLLAQQYVGGLVYKLGTTRDRAAGEYF